MLQFFQIFSTVTIPHEVAGEKIAKEILTTLPEDAQFTEEEQQQILRDAGAYAVQVSREKRAEQDKEYAAAIEENCTVIELTDDEKQQFKDAVTGMYDKVVEKAGQEVVDMMYDACGLQK